MCKISEIFIKSNKIFSGTTQIKNLSKIKKKREI